MKIMAPAHSLLRWTSRAFLTAGVLLLGWCLFVLIDARLFQQRENRELDQIVDEQRRRDPQVNIPKYEPTRLDNAPATKQAVPDRLVSRRGVIGRIEAPRVG